MSFKGTENSEFDTYAALPDDMEGSYANFSFNAVGADEKKEEAKPPPTVKATFVEAPVTKPPPGSMKVTTKTDAAAAAASPPKGVELGGSESLRKSSNADGTIPGLKEEDVAAKDGNSVTMWDRQPSMTEKKKLMMAAMGGLKMRPNVAESMRSKGSESKPKGLRQPSIKKKAPSAAPRVEKPAAAAAAAASVSSDPVEVPERQPVPSANPGFKDEYHQSSKWDFYIGYRQGVDDDAAAALADAIERDCVKEHGGACITFLDQKALKSKYIEARKKWRKSAAEQRVFGLRASRAYIFILSPESLLEMKSAHAQEDDLLFEIEHAFYGSKSIVPIYIGSSTTAGRMPNLPVPAQHAHLVAYQQWSKMEVDTSIKNLAERTSLQSASRFKDSGEMGSIIEALTSVADGNGVPDYEGTPLPTDGWAPSTAGAQAVPQAAAAAAAAPAAAAAAVPAEVKDDVETMDWGHWQLQRDHIEIGKKIGSGEFGDVCKGVMTGTGENEGMKAAVAIKTQIKGSRGEFLEEAKTMVDLHHRNLVNIYGVCTFAEPILIISELCEHGSLKDFLPSQAACSLTFEQIAAFITEIAEGMQHVEEVGFIHRDLAARNVLVEDRGSRGMRCKVSDFGLAVELDDGAEYYQGDVKKPVPIRWTAPEAVRRGRFSSASDVWSFAITVYEILTFGLDPYDGITNQEVVKQVCDEGIRLPCPTKPRAPKGCPVELHEVMMKCWEHTPSDRPNFETVVELLAEVPGFPSDEE